MKTMFKNLAVKTAVFFGLFSLLSSSAFAITFGSGEFYNLNVALSDDVYVAAGNAIIDENVSGDLIIVGGEITINGDIEQDLMVAGGNVKIFGNVGDDLRVAGGNVEVHGNIADDLIVGGGKVDISSDAVIGGTLIAGSGYLTISGNVSEDVRGIMGMLFINGQIDGDVIVTIEESLQISSDARIGGNLIYSALLESNIPEGTISGTVDFNKFERESVLKDLTVAYLMFKLFGYLAVLILALILVLAAPKLLIKSAELTKQHPFKALGMGILTVFALFVSVFLLMVSVIGIPLGLIVMAMMLIIFYFAKIFAASWLASYVFNLNKKKKHQKARLLMAVALGLLAYYIIGIIPFIGWIANLILFLIGIGSIAMTKLEYFKEMKKNNMI